MNQIENGHSLLSACYALHAAPSKLNTTMQVHSKTCLNAAYGSLIKVSLISHVLSIVQGKHTHQCRNWTALDSGFP